MHLQRQGDEHTGCGNGGASSLKKRLSRPASIAGHATGPATTLTACHRCLKGPGSFVFVPICRSSFAIRYYDRESPMVSFRSRLISLKRPIVYQRPDGAAVGIVQALYVADGKTMGRPSSSAVAVFIVTTDTIADKTTPVTTNPW